MIGIRHDFIDFAGGFGIGIENYRIDTVLHKACNPTTANYTAAYNGGLLRFMFRHDDFP
jgi:hypothetical protein